jgi:hypothetical protein
VTSGDVLEFLRGLLRRRPAGWGPPERRRPIRRLVIGSRPPTGPGPNPIPGLNPKAYYVSSLGTWQDAGRVTPTAANTDPIALWDDQSGNGYHLSQATAGNRPTLVTNRFKGYPAVDFNSTLSQWLSNAAFPWTQSKTSGHWIVACQLDTGVASSAVVSSTQDQLAIEVNGETVYGYLNGAAVQFGQTLVPTRQGVVLRLHYDGSQATNATRLRMFRNHVQRNPTYTGVIPATTFAGGPTLYMGRIAAAAGASGWFKGRVVEAAFFDAISDANATAVTNYFGAKYFSRTTKDLIFKGDSRTLGYPGTWNNTPPLTGQDSYPLHSRIDLGIGTWTMTNLGVGGTTVQQWAGSLTDVTALQDDWAAAQVVTVFGGINDRVGGRTPVQTEADMTTLIAGYLDSGITKLLVGTEPWDLATSATDLAAWTTWLRANVVPLGAYLWDLQAEPEFANAAAAGNVVYYSDGTHETQAGEAKKGLSHANRVTALAF